MGVSGSVVDPLPTPWRGHSPSVSASGWGTHWGRGSAASRGCWQAGPTQQPYGRRRPAHRVAPVTGQIKSVWGLPTTHSPPDSPSGKSFDLRSHKNKRQYKHLPGNCLWTNRRVQREETGPLNDRPASTGPGTISGRVRVRRKNHEIIHPSPQVTKKRQQRDFFIDLQSEA